jgi:hypothetical protein
MPSRVSGQSVVEGDDLAADLGAVGTEADLGPAGAERAAVGGGDPLEVDGADGQVGPTTTRPAAGSTRST